MGIDTNIGNQVANIGSRSAVNSTTGQETGFSPDVLLYIALVFGFSLMVNVWVFFRISGGLFNPAVSALHVTCQHSSPSPDLFGQRELYLNVFQVTLGMALTGAITTTRACLLVVAQVAGSIFASFLVKVMFPTKFNVRTTLSKDTSAVRGVFIEAILTAELVFTVRDHIAAKSCSPLETITCWFSHSIFADLHARQGKAQSHFHCPCRNWSCSVYC